VASLPPSYTITGDTTGSPEPIQLSRAELRVAHDLLEAARRGHEDVELTLLQTAHEVGYTPRHVQRLIKRGLFPRPEAYPFSTRCRWKSSIIDAWKRENRQTKVVSETELQSLSARGARGTPAKESKS